MIIPAILILSITTNVLSRSIKRPYAPLSTGLITTCGKFKTWLAPFETSPDDPTLFRPTSNRFEQPCTSHAHAASWLAFPWEERRELLLCGTHTYVDADLNEQITKEYVKCDNNNRIRGRFNVQAVDPVYTNVERSVCGVGFSPALDAGNYVEFPEEIPCTSNYHEGYWLLEEWFTGKVLIPCGMEVFFDGAKQIELEHTPCPWKGSISGTWDTRELIEEWITATEAQDAASETQASATETETSAMETEASETELEDTVTETQSYAAEETGEIL